MLSKLKVGQSILVKAEKVDQKVLELIEELLRVSGFTTLAKQVDESNYKKLLSVVLKNMEKNVTRIDPKTREIHVDQEKLNKLAKIKDKFKKLGVLAATKVLAKASTPQEKQADKLGREAFHAGKKRIPAQDLNLMKLIKSLNGPIGSSLPLLDAWLAGWDEENLK